MLCLTLATPPNAYTYIRIIIPTTLTHPLASMSLLQSLLQADPQQSYTFPPLTIFSAPMALSSQGQPSQAQYHLNPVGTILYVASQDFTSNYQHQKLHPQPRCCVSRATQQTERGCRATVGFISHSPQSHTQLLKLFGRVQHRKTDRVN
jgi:hypothetical protein